MSAPASARASTHAGPVRPARAAPHAALAALGPALAALGAAWLGPARAGLLVFGSLASAAALLPRSMLLRRVPRAALCEQIVRAALDGSVFIVPLALLAGAGAVAALAALLTQWGQVQLLAPLLTAGLIREAAPLVAGVIVLGRSGVSAAAELAQMRLRGQVRALEAQGLDPFLLLVAPRIIAFALAGLTLTWVLVLLALAGGYAAAAGLELLRQSPADFARSLLVRLGPRDAWALTVKAVAPSALIAAGCAFEGLSATDPALGAQRAVRRAFTRGIVTIVVLLAALSALGYAILPERV